jgi:hypothetical protein
MFRTLACVLLTACVATAQAPPVAPPPPAPPTPPPVFVPAPPAPPAPPAVTATPAMPGGMMMLNVVKVKVKDGGLVSQHSVMVPVQETVKVTEVVNGESVSRDVTVTKYVTQTVETVTKLKDVKASGTDGKAIDADDLEKKLKDGTMVVMIFGKLGDDQRKVFKDDTIFLEQVPPTPPAVPGGEGPLKPLTPIGPPGGGPKPPVEEPKKDPIKK